MPKQTPIYYAAAAEETGILHVLSNVITATVSSRLRLKPQESFISKIKISFKVVATTTIFTHLSINTFCKMFLHKWNAHRHSKGIQNANACLSEMVWNKEYMFRRIRTTRIYTKPLTIDNRGAHLICSLYRSLLGRVLTNGCNHTLYLTTNTSQIFTFLKLANLV